MTVVGMMRLSFDSTVMPLYSAGQHGCPGAGVLHHREGCRKYSTDHDHSNKQQRRRSTSVNGQCATGGLEQSQVVA